MRHKLFTSAILLFFGSIACLGQSAQEQSSKTTLIVGSHYSIPFADIDLTRGDRKTVTHELSSSIGFLASAQYQVNSKRYYFFSVDYSSFDYKSTERFFNQMEFTASDDIVNININAGIGWIFPVSESRMFNIQAGLGYMIHNRTLENFPSERTLPADLNTINITSIDWDLFDRPAISLGLGYNIKINRSLTIKLYNLLTFSLIEGDIVDTPTSNDFDTKPNMSRSYFINNLGLGIGYTL